MESGDDGKTLHSLRGRFLKDGLLDGYQHSENNLCSSTNHTNEMLKAFAQKKKVCAPVSGSGVRIASTRSPPRTRPWERDLTVRISRLHTSSCAVFSRAASKATSITSATGWDMVLESKQRQSVCVKKTTDHQM